MPDPSRAGVLIYAKQPDVLSRFYERLLDMRVLVADAGHRVIENADQQLVIHAIPPHIAAEIEIAAPPVPRDEQAIKPFFTVASLSVAAATAATLGGFVFGPAWDGPGFRMRNACDPEGNIVQLRETVT
jgi:catechol 2,3-dioxygenase-like lactoylglutathione lyase family enzyme